MNMPSPLVFNLARGNHVLIDHGRVFQPSQNESDVYLVNSSGEKVQLEESGTLKDFDKLYKPYFSRSVEEWKKQTSGKISNEGTLGLKELEKLLENDATRLFFLVEVQGPYLESIGRENEFEQLVERAKEGKKAYAEVLKVAGRQGKFFQAEIPSSAVISNNFVYEIKRIFLKKRNPIAFIHGRGYFASRELGSLDLLENRAKGQLESLFLKEVEKEDMQFSETVRKIRQYGGAFASGILEKKFFEYQNLGFGYCNDQGNVVYLRKNFGEKNGVAVRLKSFLGKTGYDKAAFQVLLDNDQIIRTSSICLAHSDFSRLKRKLRKFSTGVALVKYLHNVRDRCWKD